ncbi:uncharacterized protein LOC134245195 [Saccostrea cucullata]|uniref:uncharacterized protein LOC134245195 n=1 Tax=Saccostrea cuccullata TaxID=36930 RepID=UPI002ED4AD33
MRSYIKACAKLKKSAKETFEEVHNIYGDQQPSYRTVSRRLKKFKDGRETVKDDVRSGRPKTVSNAKYLLKIKDLVEKEGRYTVKVLARIVGISIGAVHEILTIDLGYRKISARWIPHLLNEEQKASRVACAKKIITLFKKRKNRLFSDIPVVTGDETWVHYFQPQRKFDNKIWMTKQGKRPVIVKRCQSTKKTLQAIFFDREGVVLQFPISKKRSVTGKIYKCEILHKLKQQYKNRRPKLVLMISSCCTIMIQPTSPN